MTMSGETKASFTPAKQAIFVGGVAASLGVPTTSVIIDSIADVAASNSSRRLPSIEPLVAVAYDDAARRQLTDAGVIISFRIIVPDEKAADVAIIVVDKV